jgi:hypothetical protein
MKTKTEMVALATEDEDLALVPAPKARAAAEALATEIGKRVMIRHVISDKLRATVKPTGKQAGQGRQRALTGTSKSAIVADLPADSATAF